LFLYYFECIDTLAEQLEEPISMKCLFELSLYRNIKNFQDYGFTGINQGLQKTS